MSVQLDCGKGIGCFGFRQSCCLGCHFRATVLDGFESAGLALGCFGIHGEDICRNFGCIQGSRDPWC